MKQSANMRMGSDMYPEIPPDLKWVEPWEPLDGTGDGFVKELEREMPPQHVLYGVPVVAVACRIDCDDVLFASADPSKPLALVHLTWHGPETDPIWPNTYILRSWQEFIDCVLIPTHQERLGLRNDNERR
jgi:hypothetical protein